MKKEVIPRAIEYVANIHAGEMIPMPELLFLGFLDGSLSVRVNFHIFSNAIKIKIS